MSGEDAQMHSLSTGSFNLNANLNGIQLQDIFTTLWQMLLLK